MCLTNNNIKKLNKIRSKGHVLQQGYKLICYNNVYDNFYSPVMRSMDFTLGWNVALNENNNKMYKKQPFDFLHKVTASFHLGLTKQSILFWLQRKPITFQYIVPIHFYCDEVTACEDLTRSCPIHYETFLNWSSCSKVNSEQNFVTVSRVLIKKFPNIKK